MHAVNAWLESCEWPDDPETPEEDVGISWAEISIALALHHGHWLPVRRDKRGKQYVIQSTTEMELELLDTCLQEQAMQAYSVVQHFWTLVPESVVPDHVSNGRVKSLYIQGFGSWTTGMRRRPWYPKQVEVFHILAAFMEKTNKKLDGLPLIPLDTFTQWEAEVGLKQSDWKAREKRAKKAQLEVRKQRN